LRPRSQNPELSLWALGPACALALLVFALWRLWLGHAWGEPLISPGGIVFVALLGCMAALMVEPPACRQGQAWRLALAFTGLLLLFSGQSLLWMPGGGKEPYFWPGYALLLGGAGLLLASLARAEAGRAWSPAPAFTLRWELALLVFLLLLGALARAYRLGDAPANWWFDEVNLARATQLHVLEQGEAPLYVNESVENPGMYLWIGGLVFKCFGTGVLQLRWLSVFFGWLSLLPFYFLARRMLGVAWGLASLALFCAMRWTLIPQHIAFMSGFAIFWTLCAVYFYWRALGDKKIPGFALAGLCLGFTLHCYTPARLVIPMLGMFSLLQRRLLKGIPAACWAALAAGFLAVAGPMLYYIATHWSDYALRAQQVSIMNDIRARGWGELYVSLARHLQCFNFRGDSNARHNISLWPQLDFVSGGLFVAGILWAHIRAFKDPRALLLLLWFWVMLSAGILSMTVEAPQAHRTILVAPLCALCVGWFLSTLWRALGSAWGSGWPRPLAWAAGILLVAAPFFNISELYANWPDDSATWRSFSPQATLAARRATASPADWEVYVSPLIKEYQFHGYERDVFVAFALHQQNRSFYPLNLSQAVDPGLGPAPGGVLAIWGDSDSEISAGMQREFPGIPVEAAKDPFEEKSDYLAAAIPWDKIPTRKQAADKAPFFFRP
jgi:hypothetical protein